MRDDRRVRLEYGWLAEHHESLVRQESLTVLAVVPEESPTSRLEMVREACRRASEHGPVRMLPVMSHEVEPDRLPRIVGERAHLGLVIVSGEPHVIRAATLLAENGVPRLLLVTSATVRLVSEKGLGDARTTMTSPRDSDEARDCCERFLLRASDDSDAHRRRCPALLAEGGTATRQRALRTWEQLPIAARDLVAACNGLTSHEVSQLLEGDGPATVEQTIVLAQLDADLRESLADFKQTRLSSEVLASAQIDAFRKYCGRSRLPLGGDVARALFKKGEDRERRRQGRHAVGAETRQPLGHWTHWGDLREE